MVLPSLLLLVVLHLILYLTNGAIYTYYCTVVDLVTNLVIDENIRTLVTLSMVLLMLVTNGSGTGAALWLTLII